MKTSEFGPAVLNLQKKWLSVKSQALQRDKVNIFFNTSCIEIVAIFLFHQYIFLSFVLYISIIGCKNNRKYLFKKTCKWDRPAGNLGDKQSSNSLIYKDVKSHQANTKNNFIIPFFSKSALSVARTSKSICTRACIYTHTHTHTHAHTPIYIYIYIYILSAHLKCY